MPFLGLLKGLLRYFAVYVSFATSGPYLVAKALSATERLKAALMESGKASVWVGGKGIERD